MPIQILSDGTPLTFEWLNNVAQTLNTLVEQNKDDSNVKFVGDVNGENVMVATGTKDVVVSTTASKGSKVSVPNILFPSAFKDSKVTVIAMVTTNAIGGYTTPSPAGVTVSDITSNGFNAVVQLFDEDKKFGTVKFQIKYVAIGKKPATA